MRRPPCPSIVGHWTDELDGRHICVHDNSVAHSSEGWVGKFAVQTQHEASLMFEWHSMSTKRHRVVLDGANRMSFCDWQLDRQSGKLPPPAASASAEESRAGSPLAAVIESGDIGLVRGAYFEECWEQGRPFEFRQNIPAHYFWPGPEAVDLWEKHGKCFLVILSYGWLSKSHPDPERFHIRRLARVIQELKRHVCDFGVNEVAVVVDYCSLWQSGREEGLDCRTVQQQEQFQRGLAHFNLMYLHMHTTAIKLKCVPPAEQRRYDDRGWTLFESVVIDSKAGMQNVFCNEADDTEFTFQEGQGWEFLKQFIPVRRRCLPLVPADFVEQLEDRRRLAAERGCPLFTNGKDNSFVPRKYEDVFQVILNARSRNYSGARLDDEAVQLLCKVMCSSKVEVLNFGSNRIGREGLGAILEMPCSGSTLRTLLLYENRLGEDCVQLIADALPHLRSLRKLGLEATPLSGSVEARAALQTAWARAGKAERGLVFDFPYYPPPEPDASGMTPPGRAGRVKQAKQAQRSVLF